MTFPTPPSALGLVKKVPRFIDLDLDFIANPITGQVPRKFDEEAVKRALRNLLQLNKYEKPFHPEIDPKIRSMLFEPVGPAAAILLQRRIVEVINQFEPRVELVDVQVLDQHEQNAYNVVIAFRTANNDQPIVLNLSLTRLR